MKSLKSKIKIGTCMGVTALSLSQVSGLNALWAVGQRTTNLVCASILTAIANCIPGGKVTSTASVLIKQLLGRS